MGHHQSEDDFVVAKRQSSLRVLKLADPGQHGGIGGDLATRADRVGVPRATGSKTRAGDREERDAQQRPARVGTFQFRHESLSPCHRFNIPARSRQASAAPHFAVLYSGQCCVTQRDPQPGE